MSEWISVNDKLPEEKKPVLVTWISIKGDIHSDAVAAIISGRWYWWEGNVDDTLDFDAKCIFVEVTHWMPLPKPPEMR